MTNPQDGSRVADARGGPNAPRPERNRTMHVDRRLIAIAALGCLALGAVAVTPAPDKAAVELLQVMRIDKSVTSTSEAMADVLIKANPVLLPYRPVIIEWAQKTMTWDVLGPQVAAIYSEAFTDEEMRQAAAFYRSPTGQKILDKLPELMKKTSALGADLAKAHEQELRTMIAQRANELAGQPQPQPQPQASH
jgi:hypothetical protein